MTPTKNETNLTEKQIAAIFVIISILECNGLDSKDLCNVASALKVFGCSYKDFLWVYKHLDYAIVCLEKYLPEIQQQMNNEAKDILKEQKQDNIDDTQDSIDDTREHICTMIKDKNLN